MADDNKATPDTFSADYAPGMKPYAVPIKTAQKLLAEKARSEIYKCIGRGELEAVKDGARTLIVLASIERRQGKLPRANIKPLMRPIPKRGRPNLIRRGTRKR